MKSLFTKILQIERPAISHFFRENSDLTINMHVLVCGLPEKNPENGENANSSNKDPKSGGKPATFCLWDTSVNTPKKDIYHCINLRRHSAEASADCVKARGSHSTLITSMHNFHPHCCASTNRPVCAESANVRTLVPVFSRCVVIWERTQESDLKCLTPVMLHI